MEGSSVATGSMECPMLPTPRTHTHMIIPHGHTRRVPVEAACRVIEIPGSLLCCCQNDPSQSDARVKDAAPAWHSRHATLAACAALDIKLAFVQTVSPQQPLAGLPEKAAAVQVVESQTLEKPAQKKSVEFEDEPIPVAITFLPKNTSPRRSDSVPSDEHSEALPADGAEAQPPGSWLNCCNTSYVNGPREETEPEELPSPEPLERVASPRTENHLVPPQLAGDTSCWSPGICGSCLKLDHESISTYTEEPLPQLEHALAEYPEESRLPVAYAPVEYAEEPHEQVVHRLTGPEKVDALVLSEKIAKMDLVEGATKPRRSHIVYIDHYPEPFVKSYFGDDESEQIPDHCGDFRLNKAAEILFAAGSAVGVVVTGGAVVLGAAALTAGLTVGIAATEVYKRVTNNYNI
ncbi:hypothetical protein ACSSS7_001141 [Eimeria intestinalis]